MPKGYHHGDILDFGERGWLAIDPTGLLGDRGFDYANLFCKPDHPTATAPGRLARPTEVVADEADWNASVSEPDLRISRHTGLRLVVLPARGLTCCEMGVLQVEKPKRIKVGNGPACLVGAVRSGTPLLTCTLAWAALSATWHLADGTSPETALVVGEIAAAQLSP